MSNPRRLALLLRTIRYLPATQIAARVRLVLLRRLRRMRKARMPRPAAAAGPHRPLWSGLDAARAHPGAARRIERARAIAEGRFDFIGTAFTYDGGLPDWTEPRASALWRYHLHYFDYTLDLALARDFATFRRLAESWLAANELIRGDGWHPYPVSLRLVNWCHALHAFREELGPFRPTLESAIAAHARFVFNNLEIDVRGNHLIENLRALITAGIVFGNEKWLARGLELLEVEVAEQVLDDGSHFERAPGYHLVVLRVLDELRVLLERNRTVPPWLDDAVQRMRSYLAVIRGPGDRLPLFKDTALTEDLTPADLLDPGSFLDVLVNSSSGSSESLGVDSYSEELRGTPRTPRNSTHSVSFGASGYALVRDDDIFLVADFGRPCPDYLPAHAHADMFSFELTAAGRPLIVDSGVFAYQGEWRPWFRSTAAHNTVEVAGENQSEVWASFRVARRARPSNVRRVQQNGWTMFQGQHDGYERLKPAVTHRRTIAQHRDAIVVVDELFGSGIVDAKSRVHLHPSVSFDDVQIIPFGATETTRERGWYSERFGEKKENDVLVLGARGAMPYVFGYCVALRGGVAAAMERDGTLRLRAGGRDFTLRLARDAEPHIE